MPAPKGHGRYGGRVKGVPNKSTANARAAIADFVDGNATRLNKLLDQIEKEDGPQAAFKCIVDLLEFHVPKLQRTELTGNDGADLIPDCIKVEFVSSKHSNT